jgi:hypothetical protein
MSQIFEILPEMSCCVFIKKALSKYPLEAEFEEGFVCFCWFCLNRCFDLEFGHLRIGDGGW